MISSFRCLTPFSTRTCPKGFPQSRLSRPIFHNSSSFAIQNLEVSFAAFLTLTLHTQSPTIPIKPVAVYICYTSTAFSVPHYPLIQPVFISKLNYCTSILTDLFAVTLVPSNLFSTCKVVRSCLFPLHKTFHLLSIALRKKSQIFSG